MSPDVIESRAPIKFKSVVFPLPDGPAIAVNSPFSITAETPLRAWTFAVVSFSAFSIFLYSSFVFIYPSVHF